MASKMRGRPDRKRQPNQLADLGLFDIPNLDAMDDDDDSEVDESALESELEALLSGNAPSRPRPKPKPKAAAVDIEKLAQECLKDDDEEDDGDISTDEDLLNELQTITTSLDQEKEVEPATPESIPKSQSVESCSTENSSTTSMLQERLTMYNEAVKAAKAVGDTSKVRRYGRAVKTLEGLIKQAKSGSSINEDDIPPVVKIPKNPTDSDISRSSNKPVVDLISTDPNAVENRAEFTGSISEKPQPSRQPALLTKTQLLARRDQYKIAALQAKKLGNKDLALSHLRTVKTFDAVIKAMDDNLPVDLSNVPPAPSGFPEIATVGAKGISKTVEQAEIQTSSSDIEKAALAAANEPEQPELFAAPPAPTTVLEALQQRLDKYNATKKTAEEENNSGKVRRLQRIIKQYETAMKDYKAGKNVDFEELPVPPGFGPIPVPQKEKPISEKETPKDQTQSKIAANTNQDKSPGQAGTSIGKKPKVQRTNTSTVGEKQLEFLLERQKLFRQAAFSAKQNGDMQQAKEYLRMSKGFDSMIQATTMGLPIDATTIPTPPQLESDFVIVDVSDCTENPNCSQEELYETLEKDLCRQIEMCTQNKDHFFHLGDVSSASKFEKLALESKKDLAVIKNSKKKNDPVPRFHYETRLFSMVQCHTDLGDNDIQVTVERGINLPGKPDDLDSYVKLEFPIPPETPQRAKTHTVRDTNNPIFQEEFKFEFNRKSRSQLRQFKRQALKLDVMSKGGFLRSDSHLGTVAVKLADLESKCLIHDCFNLKDGRKALGGKLEVKLRVREPLLVKQVEEVREKWLVIGS